MYSTCLFCNRHLGRNEAVEHFPVGRRLAFDAAKGRLWVVCRSCERWNLSPLEERWEAIDSAEKLYRETRRRVSTENIGLARLADGTELVRIGRPLRPEFAAWRYGDQFGRRRRRRIYWAAASLAGVGTVAAAGALAGVTVGAFSFIWVHLSNRIVNGQPEQVVARVRTEKNGTLSVRRRHLAETGLSRGHDGPLALRLRFMGGETRLDGREALRVAGVLMPHVNRYGGKPDTIRSALERLDNAGGPDGYFERLARHALDDTWVSTKPIPPGGLHRQTGLFGLLPQDRLALEMALHEEAELRAMRGEIAALEQAWRDAEEIAAIADSLLVPAEIHETVERIRHG